MNCEYCGSGIHSSEDLYIYDEGDEYGCYHTWCWEAMSEDDGQPSELTEWQDFDPYC